MQPDDEENDAELGLFGALANSLPDPANNIEPLTSEIVMIEWSIEKKNLVYLK